MNINKQLQEIQELKERLKVLENEVLNLVQPKQEYKRWRAIEDKYYYTFNKIGHINKFTENYDPTDNFLYSIGNYFETKEEAQEYKENLITKQKLKDLALRLNKGGEIDWNDECQSKYYIYLAPKDVLYINSINRRQILGQVCCLDNDFLNIAKEEIGEKALIKLIKSGV